MWNRLSFNSSRNKENKILYSNGSIRSTFRKSSCSRYDEDSVSLLRSLYATLLAAIQVPPSLVSQSNVPLSFLQQEEDEGLIIPCCEETVEEEEEEEEGEVKGYTSSLVRNFRSEKKQSKKWHDDDDDDDNEECEISFEIFHPESPADAACISRIWRRHLSAITTTVNKSYSNNNNNNNDNNNDKADLEMSEMEIAALIQARQIEARVIELIRSIGELVVYGEQRSNLFTDFKQNNNNSNSNNSVNRKKKKYNHAQQCPSFHNGFVFEYFCDKNILALLVDIVTAKPSSSSLSSLSSSSAFSTSSGQNYSGVVWTPLVKAQVLQTISIFISNVSDPKSLYYLLSNNYINRIISSIVPLEQWSTGALEEILPVYISFLKSLALKLAKTPHLFQFFCHEGGSVHGDGDDGDGEDGAKVYWLSSKFPLFGAAVEVASSSLPVAKDDTFVHTTALNILLHLFQMPQEEVRSMIGGECLEEQKRLVCHLCDEIVMRHNNLVDLLWLSFRMGQPCDNTQLHSVMMDEVAKLDDVLHFVNDLLWCSQRTVNARFCEYFMQYVMVGTVLEDLQKIQEQNKEKSKEGTSCDCDNIEKEEKGEKAENGDSVQNVAEQKVKFMAALLTLFRVFSVVDYAPLLKMIAISFLHPNTPLRQHQQQQSDNLKYHGKDFVLTPALNAIAKNDFVVLSRDTRNSDEIDVSKEESAADTPQVSSNDNPENKASQHVDVDRVIQAVPNINRYLIMESVSGALGERCFIMTSILLQSILQSKAMDSQMYKVLKLVPTVDSDKENIQECKMHSLDVPLAKFFDDVQNISPSQEGSYSMDCAVSLVILYLPHLIQALTEQEAKHQGKTRMQHLDIFTNIRLAKESFASESLRLKGIDGLCDFFTILMEEEIQKLFSILNTSGPQLKFQCDLQTLSSEARNNILHILITNHKTLPTNKTHEINTARFVIRTLVILTSLYQNLIQVHTNLSAELLETSYSSLHDSIPSRWSHGFVNIEKISVASKDICSMGCLDRQSIVGTDYFIKDNKTHFSISPSLALTTDGEEVSSVLLPSISWKTRNPSPPTTTKNATTPTLPTIIDPEKTKRRVLADKILMKSAFSSKTEMILVVDETELLILKSKIKNDVNNTNTKDKHETKVVGTILCTTLLSNIIAIAADDAWLHIAMRNVEDVGVLIRKGNMALRFQDKTTCFVAKKCIEESRDASIRILSSTVDMFLGRESDSSFS